MIQEYCPLCGEVVIVLIVRCLPDAPEGLDIPTEIRDSWQIYGAELYEFCPQCGSWLGWI